MSEQVLILAGPSGSGKSTIANELVAKHEYKRVRSATTRLQATGRRARRVRVR